MARPDDKPQAIDCQFASDAVTIRRDGNGELRYFRGDQEYSYRHPFILELEITKRCNLRCVHCYAEAENREFAHELTTAEIETVLRDGRAIGMEELSLTGGEVLSRPNFLDIVDCGLRCGYHVRFVTNATLVDDAFVTALCQRPIKLVTVSLDSVSPAAHEKIRGRGSHRPAIDGIHKLQEAGFRLSIITAFSRWNIDEFDDILAFCLAHRLDWQVQITSAKGRCPKGITLSPDEYYRLGEKVAVAYVQKLPIHIIPMDDLATFSHFHPLGALSATWQGRCTGGLLNIFVRANGDVTPCSALAFPECIVGNVRQISLAEICRQERCRHALAWLAGDKLSGACADCCMRQHCHGGCPEILLSMCAQRTENEYCYWRIEQQRIIAEVFGHV